MYPSITVITFGAEVSEVPEGPAEPHPLKREASKSIKLRVYAIFSFITFYCVVNN